MFLTRINEDLQIFINMYNNHKLLSENSFTPLQLLSQRIDSAPDEVQINWDEYGIDPNGLGDEEYDIDDDNVNDSDQNESIFYPLRCPLPEDLVELFASKVAPFTLVSSNLQSFIPWFTHIKELLRVMILMHDG